MASIFSNLLTNQTPAVLTRFSLLRIGLLRLSLATAIMGLDKIMVVQYHRAQYEMAKDAYNNRIEVSRDCTFSLTLMISGNVGVYWDPNKDCNS